MLAIFIFGLIVQAGLAESNGPEASKREEQIKTFDEFLQLSPRLQRIYIDGLRLVIEEWSQTENSSDVIYETASLDETFKNSREPAGVVITPVSPSQVLPSNGASATSLSDRPCLYAGWVSEYGAGGRGCKVPHSCGGGRVQCNPILFGSNVCAPQGRSATLMCVRNEKSLSTVRLEISKNQDAWNALRLGVESACANTTRQAKVCRMIRGRIARLNDAVGESVATQPSLAISDLRKVGNPIRVKIPPAKVQLALAQVSIDTDHDGPTALGVNASKTITVDATSTSLKPDKGQCVPTWLMQPFEDPKLQSMSDRTLMSLEQAKVFLCSTAPLNDEWIRYERAEIAKYVKSATSREYNRKWNGLLAQTFEACLALAQRHRANPEAANEADVGLSATVEGRGAEITVRTSAGEKPTGSTESYLGILLRQRGVSICRTERVSDSSRASAATSPASPGASSSGADQ